MLSELLEYANTDPPPQDQQQVLATEQYLAVSKQDIRENSSWH